MKSKIVAAISDADDFLVATHVQPDGDALGSMLAIGALLRQLGKHVRLAADPEDIPSQYAFLPGLDDLEKAPSPACDVLITVDAANRDRLGGYATALEAARNSINIDHHRDNSKFAAINWIEESATSASQMVYELWKDFGLEPEPEAATCIYTGMLTDTGRWQYSNTTPEGLRIAASLMEGGVKPNVIFQHIFEHNSVGWLRLLGVGFNRAVVDPKLGLAYTHISLRDLRETGATMAETEGLVEWLRATDGVEVALFIKEKEAGEFKVSGRSRGVVDVGRMATSFGGGGHRNAAGFTATGSVEQIVDRVTDWLINDRKTSTAS